MSGWTSLAPTAETWTGLTGLRSLADTDDAVLTDQDGAVLAEFSFAPPLWTSVEPAVTVWSPA